jgi:hypothetical protein
MRLAVVAAIAALGGSLVGGVVVASSTTGQTATRTSNYFGEPIVAGVYAGGTSEVAYAFGDLDGDGLPDLVTIGRAFNSAIGAEDDGLALLKNDGAGHLVFEEILFPSDGVGPFTDVSYPSIVDLDGDGVSEVVLIQIAPPPVGWQVVVFPNLLAPWQPSPARAADLNGDQVVDGADLGLMLGLWGPVEPE